MLKPLSGQARAGWYDKRTVKHYIIKIINTLLPFSVNHYICGPEECPAAYNSKYKTHMKKLILSLIAAVAVSGVLFSQQNTSTYSAFQFGLVPPLSTNGKHAAEYTNGASVNLLVGISNNERNFALAGLANIIRENSQGVTIAGFYNYVGHYGRGVMIAGFGNTIKGDYAGTQIAGFINTSRTIAGGQVAGFCNIVSGSMRGPQIAGFFNSAKGNMSGLQIAGFGNIVTGNINGPQIAGFGNIARGNVHGPQIAGFANISKGNVSGPQIAGFMNIGANVSGPQIAGLINIADNSDWPIGIINIVKNGEMSVGVSWSDRGSILASFRSGGHIMYGIVGLGYNYEVKDRYTFHAGIGAHIPVAGRLRINTEITGTSINGFSDKSVHQYSLAILPAFRVGNHLEIFAGPSVSFMDTENMAEKGIFPNNTIWDEYSATRLQAVFVGMTAGINYIF